MAHAKSVAGFDTDRDIVTNDPHCMGPVILSCNLDRDTAKDITRSPPPADTGQKRGMSAPRWPRLRRSDTPRRFSPSAPCSDQGTFDSVWAQLTHRRRHVHAHLSVNRNCTPFAKVAWFARYTQSGINRVQTQPYGNHSRADTSP